MTKALENSDKVHSLLKDRAISIVDDSRAFCAGIVSLLSPLQCKLHFHYDPTTAIAAIPAESPDIVITDFEMGAVSGLDLIQALRKISALETVPILVLTGRDDAKTLISVMLSGADSFVSKSDIPEVLVAKLVNLLRIRILYQEIIRLKHFSAIKTMIGTYNHEFGNVLAIIDGKVKRLERKNPTNTEDPDFQAVKNNLLRMAKILEKLASLQEYEEESYSSLTSVLKVS